MTDGSVNCKTPKETLVQKFNALAPQVYGRYWRTDIGRHLCLSARTVMNWQIGIHPPDVAVILLLQLYMDTGMLWSREAGAMMSCKVKRRS